MTVGDPPETDPRRARIWASHQALNAHGIVAEVAESEPLLSVAGLSTFSIRCEYRTSDNGNLWLYDNETREPIAPADAAHIHEAITWIKGRMVARART